MSKASKSRSKEMRRKQKKARKEAMKAQYEAWAKSGQNKKSKRFKQNSKVQRQVRVVRHANGRCHNVGCELCFPHDYSAKRVMKAWQGSRIPHHIWVKMPAAEQAKVARMR